MLNSFKTTYKSFLQKISKLQTLANTMKKEKEWNFHKFIGDLQSYCRFYF